VAVHAAAAAVWIVESIKPGAKDFFAEQRKRIHAGALALALLVTLGSIAVVWQYRQSVMANVDVGLALPFVFPPLALAVAFVASASFCTVGLYCASVVQAQ